MISFRNPRVGIGMSAHTEMLHKKMAPLNLKQRDEFFMQCAVTKMRQDALQHSEGMCQVVIEPYIPRG